MEEGVPKNISKVSRSSPTNLNVENNCLSLYEKCRILLTIF